MSNTLKVYVYVKGGQDGQNATFQLNTSNFLETMTGEFVNGFEWPAQFCSRIGTSNLTKHEHFLFQGPFSLYMIVHSFGEDIFLNTFLPYQHEQIILTPSCSFLELGSNEIHFES